MKKATSSNPRILLAIFSHNRLIGLRNLLRSIDRHLGDVDVYVFDDHSSDPRIGQFLQEQESAGRLRWCKTGEHTQVSGRLGGLYENLNAALDIGISEEYDLLLLLQDDHQILWFEPAVFTRARAFFLQREDALMLDPRFIRRIRYHTSYGGTEDEPAISMRRGAVAVGFIPPWRAKEIGFRFGSSERESSDIALKQGACCYQSRFPFVAEVPLIVSFHISPPFVRGRLWNESDEEKYVDKEILEPLNNAAKSIVKSVPSHCAIFAEDVIHRTDQRTILYPHFHNEKLIGRYRSLTLSALWNELLRVNRIRHLEPQVSFALHRRSRWTTFILRKQRTSRLWSYSIYLVDSVKTALFFLVLYPIISLWMRREAEEFMRQLRAQELQVADQSETFEQSATLRR